jgi:hypothetical protein
VHIALASVVIFRFLCLLLASVLLRSYTMTTSTTFTWVHACVKDRVLEHLHGVFLIF